MVESGVTASFGHRVGGTGFVNQSGGALSVASNAFLLVGVSGASTYNLSGGTVALGGGLGIAQNAGSTGVVNQSGGMLTHRI